MEYPKDTENWERDTLKDFLFSFINEQRRARRWKLFFQFSVLTVIVYSLVFDSFIPNKMPSSQDRPHVALIDIMGAITHGEPASSDSLLKYIQSAFDNPQAQALILRINSQGGSAVQARQVFKEIMRLKKSRENFKVYAVIEDIGASAAYLIATAADEIYADETSLVGSIGVLFNQGFGFTKAMEKLGIERRLITAGDHKAFLDPFSQRDPEEERFMKRQISLVHKEFIQSVQHTRGKKIKDPHNELFSGLIWAGIEAQKLGLIDGFADHRQVIREQFQDLESFRYNSRDAWFEKFLNMSHQAQIFCKQLLALFT